MTYQASGKEMLGRNVLLYSHFNYEAEMDDENDYSTQIASHEARFFDKVWSKSISAECTPYKIPPPGLNMERVAPLLKKQYFNAEALKHFSCFINQYYFVSKDQVDSLSIEDKLKFNEILESLDLIKVDSADSEVYRALNKSILVKRAKDGNNVISSSNSIVSGTRSNSVSLIRETKKERQDINIVYHEAFVAINYLNSLREEIPNFMYVYGVLRVKLDQKNGREREALEIAEFLDSDPNTPEGPCYSLHDVLTKHMMNLKPEQQFKELLEIMICIYCALKHANRFHHNDAHGNNILVRKLHAPREFRYRDNSLEGDSEVDYVIVTKWVPIFIDFGRSTYRTTEHEQKTLGFPSRLSMFPEDSRFVYDSTESDYLHILMNVRHIVGDNMNNGNVNPVRFLFNACLSSVRFNPSDEVALYGCELSRITTKKEYLNSMRNHLYRMFEDDDFTIDSNLRRYRIIGIRNDTMKIDELTIYPKTMFDVLLSRSSKSGVNFALVQRSEGVSRFECARRANTAEACHDSRSLKLELGKELNIDERMNRLRDRILNIRIVDFVGWQAADFIEMSQVSIINDFVNEIVAIYAEHRDIHSVIATKHSGYGNNKSSKTLRHYNMFYIDNYGAEKPFPSSGLDFVSSLVNKLVIVTDSIEASVMYIINLQATLVSESSKNNVEKVKTALQTISAYLEIMTDVSRINTDDNI